MFPSDPHNEAVHGGGGNRTRELCSDKPSDSAESFVYFIQAGNDGPVKIGYTTHPEVRLARLQVANPRTLHLLAAFPVRERRIEPALHRKFAKHHIRGEWFRPHPDLLTFIAELGPNVGLGFEAVSDPRLAPDDDDYNIELFERGEVTA